MIFVEHYASLGAPGEAAPWVPCGQEKAACTVVFVGVGDSSV